MAVVRPSATKIEYLSHYLPFQAACVNFNKQLFPEREKHPKKFSHSPTRQDKKTTLNIDRMITAHGLFYKETENNGLWNVFKGVKATNEQTHDLLNFREIVIHTKQASEFAQHSCSSMPQKALHILRRIKLVEKKQKKTTDRITLECTDNKYT